jgi:hypothetical protein
VLRLTWKSFSEEEGERSKRKGQERENHLLPEAFLQTFFTCSLFE